MPYVATNPLHEPSSADALPDFDEWGWDEYWSADDWIEWHAAMKQEYGLRQANETFLAYWQEQGAGASPYSARSFDSSFREYARANGFLDDLFDGPSVIFQPLGWGTDILGGGTNVAGNLPGVINAAGNALGAVSVIWPVLLLGAILIYGQQARKSARSLFS